MRRRQLETRRQKLQLGISFLLILLAIMLVMQLPLALVYVLGMVSLNGLTFLSTALLSLSFPISVFAYLLSIKKLSVKKAINELGLSRQSFGLGMIGLGIVLFLLIFGIEAVVTAIEEVFHVTIETNVSTLLAGAPLWFYVFATIVAPVDEEILFRGFLVPRIGIIASAVVFAILHYTYYSTYGIEMIAAFIFGLLAGYVYKKTQSLYPSIIAHVLVNLLAVISLVL